MTTQQFADVCKKKIELAPKPQRADALRLLKKFEGLGWQSAIMEQAIAEHGNGAIALYRETVDFIEGNDADVISAIMAVLGAYCAEHGV